MNHRFRPSERQRRLAGRAALSTALAIALAIALGAGASSMAFAQTPPGWKPM